ncbi:hypothetical protein [Cardiobacterium hominis]|uniref:hypothetical protein n=1 Tax=Cardiobacterium hominis TaxID=2718 RepID=UPI0028EBD939|nr:hypothetical protein [Cardiobacterium hominis]
MKKLSQHNKNKREKIYPPFGTPIFTAENREKTRKLSRKLENKHYNTAMRRLILRLSQDKLLQLILPFFTRIAFCTITGEI